MNRRIFLQTASRGSAAAAGLLLLSQCTTPKRTLLMDTGSNAKKQTVGDPSIHPSFNRDHYWILTYASLASSGHNTQPWQINVRDDGSWELHAPTDRRLPAVDPANRELYLSLGAFLENLALAAGSMGYRAEIQTVAQTTMDTHAANIRLHSDRKTGYPLQKLKMRRTLRSGYSNKEITARDLDAITNLSETGLADQIHFIPASNNKAAWLAEATVEANRIQAFRDPAQEELADWIRFSNKEAKKHRDGLTPATMEIDGLAGWIVRNFYNRKRVLTESFRKKSVSIAEEQVQQTGGWLVLTSRNQANDINNRNCPDSLLQTGRLYERLFLNIRDYNIAFHPMSQVLEEKPLKNQIQKALDIEDEIQFVIRTGYVDRYPKPVSLRRPVKQFIKI